MNRALKDLLEEIKSCQLSIKLADKLYDIQLKKESKVSQLEYELDKLDVSIQELSKISFQSIYQTLLNKKEKQLELEKHYYLKVSIEYNQLIEDISAIKNEIELLKSSSLLLKKHKKELRQLLKIRKSPLKQKQLILYKSIFSKIDKKIEIVKEIKEAIKQGSKLNRKLNFAIRFLEKVSNNEHYLLSGSKINPKFIVDLNKYQKKISTLVVDATILEKEVKDIFEAIVGTDQSILLDIKSFEEELEVSLISDLVKSNSFKSSLQALKNYKFNLMTMIKLLRKDVKKIEKVITQLDLEEHKIFESINML